MIPRHFRCATIAAAALLLAAATAQASEGSGYLHVSWTERDGLPGSSISSMAQDRDGYLWLIANGALVRFDGVRFVEWSALQVARDLPPLRRSAVCAGRDGSLWIGVAGGVVRLKDGAVTTFDASNGLPSQGEDTTKVHVRRVFAKLNVNDRTAAVRVALQRGIIHLD